jgi:hypothetical protein
MSTYMASSNLFTLDKSVWLLRGSSCVVNYMYIVLYILYSDEFCFSFRRTIDVYTFILNNTGPSGDIARSSVVVEAL